MQTDEPVEVGLELRRLAAKAVFRGVAFELGVTVDAAIDSIAGACHTSTMEVKRWPGGDGIPAPHVTAVLTLLNTRNPNKWQRYSVRPGPAEAAIWDRVDRERRLTRAVATGRRAEDV